MIRVLMVCHGNICRSPMAEFILKDKAAACGLEDCFTIASAATSREEIGNPVYPPARRELARHGISCAGKRAVQVRPADYGAYDLLIVMDGQNLRNLLRITGDVADPWYTDDFETCYRDIAEGCEGLLRQIGNKK